MAARKSPLLFRALLDVSEARWSKILRGNPRRPNVRHLGSCGALVARRTSLPASPTDAVGIPSRSFINLAAPVSARRMEYTESRTMAYSPEQMYSVVARVDQYKHFVPWCKKFSLRTIYL